MCWAFNIFSLSLSYFRWLILLYLQANCFFLPYLICGKPHHCIFISDILFFISIFPIGYSFELATSFHSYSCFLHLIKHTQHFNNRWHKVSISLSCHLLHSWVFFYWGFLFLLMLQIFLLLYLSFLMDAGIITFMFFIAGYFFIPLYTVFFCLCTRWSFLELLWLFWTFQIGFKATVFLGLSSPHEHYD